MTFDSCAFIYSYIYFSLPGKLVTIAIICFIVYIILTSLTSPRLGNEGDRDRSMLLRYINFTAVLQADKSFCIRSDHYLMDKRTVLVLEHL